jgi:hypothetical protein
MSTPVASLASLHNIEVLYGAAAALQPAVVQPAQGRARVHVAVLSAVTALRRGWHGAVSAGWAEVA